MPSPTRQRPRLCLSCRKGLFGRKAWREFWENRSLRPGLGASFSTSGSNLMIGKVHGCVLCKKILQKIPQIASGTGIKVETRFIKPSGVRPDKIDTLRITIILSKSEVGYFLYAAPFAKSGSTAAPYFRTPPNDHRRVQNFEPTLAKSWIYDCKTHHSECSREAICRMPTRLLDVTQNGSPTVRLCVLPKNEHHQYAALSYCWGCSHPFTTEKLSIEEHMAGINISDMPQTFQDAVYVARQLGIRFLWIDALCIIQDSEDDMTEELSHMRYYYQNALFVVAASKAKDVTQGFLEYRQVANTVDQITPIDKEHEVLAVEVPFFDFNGGRGTIFFQLDPPTLRPADEPISQRAWTFQERLLCPRFLSFPSTGGFFLQCEREQRQDGTIHGMTGLGSERMYPHRKWTGDMTDCDLDNPHEAWMTHVREYSWRGHSIPEDKCNAMAGIAELYHATFKRTLGDYIAGHWTNHLMTSLHWYSHVADPRFALHDAKKVRPPSWSWMSVNVGILPLAPAILQKNYVGLARILHIGAELVTEKLPFGPVTLACLSLRGKIGKFLWKSEQRHPQRPSLCYDTGRLVERAETFADDLEALPEHQQIVYALPLCVAGAGSLLHGLILLRVVPNYNGLYRRIGYFFNAEKKLLDACRREMTVSIV